MAEINRIKEQEKLDTGDANLVERALTASSLWTIREDFGNSWFETGDRTNQAIPKDLMSSKDLFMQQRPM